jgi:hypothetical protein
MIVLLFSLGDALCARLCREMKQAACQQRGGAARAQSRPAREVNLEDEGSLRSLIESLLAEAAP